MRRGLSVLFLALTAAAVGGCDGPDRATPAPASAASSPEDVKASSEIQVGLSKIINDADRLFLPLQYEFDEDLLQILDQLDAYLTASPGPDAKAPRTMPRLDEATEVAHLRETIRRWSAKTGKALRPLIDPLKAEVAARKPGGPAFHPAFHKRFAAAFDDLIPFEVAEIRERRNRSIHDQAKAFLDPYRTAHPALVKAQEEFLAKPPYNRPPDEPPAGPARGPVTPPG